MAGEPCREQIAVKAFEVLQTVTELTWERERKDTLETGSPDTGILYEGDEQPADIFTGQDAFELEFMVQVALRKAGAAAATAKNLVRAKLMRALLADRTLGGLVNDLQITEPGEVIGVDDDADDCEGFFLSFVVRYATVEGDPFTFSQ